MKPPRKLAAAISVAGLLAVAACGGNAGATSSGGSGSSPVSVVGFSVLEQANQQVISDFQKSPAGKGVSFTTSYGASGDQSRAVEAGLAADEVHFSLEPDMTRLVDDGLVAKDWNTGPDHGICTQSVVAFVVRPRNPKHITGWDDLVKPGIRIVTPNPNSSGSARWNLLAAWGHVSANGGSEAQAKSYMQKFFTNVVSMPSSGRDATTAFQSGTGDVLVSYENEAILARQEGAKFDYLVPSDTLLIQNPCAVTKQAGSAADAFLNFQHSLAGQTDYARTGFRPLDPSIHVSVKGANDPSNPFPQPQELLTIDKNFGGWASATTKYFDENTGILTKLQAAAGKS